MVKILQESPIYVEQFLFVSSDLFTIDQEDIPQELKSVRCAAIISCACVLVVVLLVLNTFFLWVAGNFTDFCLFSSFSLSAHTVDTYSSPPVSGTAAGVEGHTFCSWTGSPAQDIFHSRARFWG